jgi:hypothetical protein
VAQSVSPVQLLVQVEPAQVTMFPAHAAAFPGAHAPLLVHVLLVCWPFAQVEPQAVPALAYVQLARDDPLQVPPQAVPAPPHAERPVCGAPLTAVHAPCAPLTSHASHCPVHAWSQQKPSMQKPVPHSSAAVHLCAAPVSFFTQIEPLQYASVAQSPSLAQLVLQLPLAQAYGSHGIPPLLAQLPLPSQTIPATLPPVHELMPHDLPEGANRVHAPVPLQVPSGPHVPASSRGQLPRGGTFSYATGPQVPSAVPLCLREAAQA